MTTQAAENTQMLANISSQLRSSYDHIQEDLRSVLVLVISEIQDLNTRFRSLARPSLVHAPTSSHASVIPGAVLSTRDLRMRAEAEDQSSIGTSSHGTIMALTRAQPRFSRHQASNICNTLVTQIEMIFRLVIACVLVALQKFLVFFPQVLLAEVAGASSSSMLANPSSASDSDSEYSSPGRARPEIHEAAYFQVVVWPKSDLQVQTSRGNRAESYPVHTARRGLLDTGVDINLVAEGALDGTGYENQIQPDKILIQSFGKMELPVTLAGFARIPWHVNGKPQAVYTEYFWVVPRDIECEFDFLLGREWIEETSALQRNKKVI